MTSRRGFLSRLSQPQDGASLAVFRMAFGLLLAWDAGRQLIIGAVGRHYGPEQFHFSFLGFGWVRPWPGEGMSWHFCLLGLLGLCLALGWRTRLVAGLSALGWTYALLIDKTNFQNHSYLICLVALVLVFVPSQAVWSWDARRARRAGRPTPGTVPLWAVWVLRFEVVLPYVFGAVAKLDDDWLSGAVMTWILAGHRDIPVIGHLFGEPAVIGFYTWVGVLFDALIVPAVLWRRTRAYALCAMVVFHGMNKLMFGLDIFPWFMMAATLLLLPPDWPRRVMAWWRKQPAPESAVGRPSSGEPAHRPLSSVRLGLLAMFVGVQVLLPFQHFVHAGSVLWTMEGYYFTWHMKMRNTQSKQPMFRLRDKLSGDIVRPAAPLELSPRQGFRLPTDPDLVHQYCREMARRQVEATGRDVAVQAFVELSLNGRPFQRLVDAEVDLAAEPRRLGGADWILPLTTPLFPQRPLPAELSAKK